MSEMLKPISLEIYEKNRNKWNENLLSDCQRLSVWTGWSKNKRVKEIVYTW